MVRVYLAQRARRLLDDGEGHALRRALRVLGEEEVLQQREVALEDVLVVRLEVARLGRGRGRVRVKAAAGDRARLGPWLGLGLGPGLGLGVRCGLGLGLGPGLGPGRGLR